MTTDFALLARSQRACRQFLPDDVPDADIERMLELAVHAPSAENLQPWEFVVVRDAAIRASVADLARRVWDGGGRAISAPRLDPRILEDTDRATAEGFGGAPVLVVVGVDISPLPPQFAAPSTFPAVQNLLLAAAAYGYGSALTTFTALLTDELRAAVGFPAGIEPVAVVPIGRPARRLGPSRREPFETKTHRDRYGRAWARSGTVVHGAG